MDRLNILMLLSFFAILYLFFLRPQNKKRKEQENFMNNLKEYDAVVTIGGLCGTIYKIDDKKVTILVDSQGHKLEFLRNYISIEETIKANKK